MNKIYELNVWCFGKCCFLFVRMLSFVKFVSHKLVLIDMEIAQTIRSALVIGVHIRGSTTLKNFMTEGVIGSDRLWGSLRGLMDHAGSADEEL